FGYGELHGWSWSIDTNPPPFSTMSYNDAFIDLLMMPSEEDRKSWPHSEVQVTGLKKIAYLDTMLDDKRSTKEADGIMFECEVNKIYVNTAAEIAIVDSVKKITLCKEGLPDTGILTRLFSFAVVWSPWDKKAKAMVDFGDDEYRHMLCVEAAAVETPITLKPGEDWEGRLELSAVPSSSCSGQLNPHGVLQ
ncbi:hypothetical protein IFM89_000201, partial [Coptis chinensis]